MNILGYLKRWLRRHHRTVGAICIFLALLTFFLEQSYVAQQRDLLYWRDHFLLTIGQMSYLVLFVTLLSLLSPRWTRSGRLYISWAWNHMCHIYRRRKFANFIMRRLLLQLELAMLRLPDTLEEHQLDDPTMRQRYQLAKDAAYKAVDLFRRDAAALLLGRGCDEGSFFVLPEEELPLLNGGYARIGLNVSEPLLRRLLYPQVSSVN